jgi:hypothetical protein
VNSPLHGVGYLEFLPRGPEQNFYHVHIIRLAHGEYDHVGKGVRGDRNKLIELAHVLREVGFGDAVGQFGGHSARRDDGRADLLTAKVYNRSI